MATDAFHLFRSHPSHPGLNQRKLAGTEMYSISLSSGYRAIYRLLDSETREWVFVGDHDDYETFLRNQKWR